MKNRKKKLCPKCLNILKNETNKKLKREYPFFCSSCDENFYNFEIVKTIKKR